MDDSFTMGQHTSQQFDRELEALRTKALAMGGLVEAQCEKAVEALVKGDGALADQVALGDGPINALEVEISAECLDILARRQPAASDLRMILSVIRLVADLERVGDEAEKIGRLAAALADSRKRSDFSSSPRHLGNSVVSMLHGALDAFARMDVEAAVAVAARDKDIDKEFESVTRLMLTHVMEEPQQVKNMLRVNWCARAMERIGDHAENICEEVIFLVRGSDVRHLSIEEIQARFAPGKPG